MTDFFRPNGPADWLLAVAIGLALFAVLADGLGVL